jgi:hypothetical protein
MRCPSCDDEFEPHVTWCGTCRVELIPEGAAAPPAVPDARLGLFHAAVAHQLGALLERRGIPYETVTRDGDVELVVPRADRDQLRTEVSMSWPDVLDALADEEAAEVHWAGHDEQYPGWVDPPLGGWVDRNGHLVVDLEDEPREGVRTLGPMLVVVGAGLLVLTWWADLGVGGGFAGVALVLFGLILPR